MKKLFLFVAVATLGLTTSCSSDDNSKGGEGGATGNSELKVTIDGVAKTFNNIVVNEDTETYGGETWTELTVTATIDGSANEIITFELDKGDVGANVVYSSTYSNINFINVYYGGTFVIQTNSNNRLKGTFSGEYQNGASDEAISITNGSFDISY